jgi:hypothetical protein
MNMPRRKKAYNLLFAIFRARDKINSLHMPHIDFVTEDISEDNLCNISERDSVRKTTQQVRGRTSFFDIHPNYHLQHAVPVKGYQTNLNRSNL